MLCKNPKGRIVEVPVEMWEKCQKEGYTLVDQMPKTEHRDGPLLTVSVLAWNRFDLTKRCIESILTHTVSDFELIVVNNASTDETKEYLDALMAEDSRVRAIHNETNRGVAGGRNDSIKAARGAYIAFFDNDSTVGEKWDQIMLDVFSRHPHAGFVGHNGTMMHEYTHKGMRMVTLFDDREVRCDLVSGGATMIRKEVFDEVGLLDEWGMGEFWHEDAEICLRAARAGWESYAVRFPWIHEAHSTYREEKGEAWMEKFHENLTYIKHKLTRHNEITIFINEDSLERDLVNHGRAFAEWLTRNGKVCIVKRMPPVIPASIRRSTAFIIGSRGRRFFYMGVKNSQRPEMWDVFLTDECDEVFVPSTFSADVLDSGHNVGVDNPGISTEVFHSDAKPTALLGPDSFVFFHFGSSKQHGTDAVIRAYFEEFTREDKTLLVIKTSGASDTSILSIIESLKEEGRVNAPYVIHSDEWTSSRLAAFLTRTAQKGAFVYPARCDSDAIRPNLAKACHAPIIALPYAALEGFDIEAPVRFSMVPSPYLNNPAEPFYTSGESPEWAEPDMDDLRRVMREATNGIAHHAGSVPSREESFKNLLIAITR